MPLVHSARVALCLIVVVAAGWSPAARSVEEGICPERPPRLSTAKKPRPAAENLPTDIRAQELRSTQGGFSEFAGNVEMHRGDQSLTADELRYDAATGQADAAGNVTLKDSAHSYYQTQETQLNLESRI